MNLQLADAIADILHVNHSPEEKDRLCAILFQRAGLTYSREAAKHIYHAAYKMRGGFWNFEYVTDVLFRTYPAN